MKTTFKPVISFDSNFEVAVPIEKQGDGSIPGDLLKAYIARDSASTKVIVHLENGQRGGEALLVSSAYLSTVQETGGVELKFKLSSLFTRDNLEFRKQIKKHGGFFVSLDKAIHQKGFMRLNLMVPNGQVDVVYGTPEVEEDKLKKLMAEVLEWLAAKYAIIAADPHHSARVDITGLEGSDYVVSRLAAIVAPITGSKVHVGFSMRQISTGRYAPVVTYSVALPDGEAIDKNYAMKIKDAIDLLQAKELVV